MIIARHTYESGNMNVGELGTWATLASGGTIATSTTRAHHGLRSALTDGIQVANEFAWSNATIAAATLVFQRCYWYPLTAPNAGAMFAMSAEDGATPVSYCGWNQATGTWFVYDFHTATMYTDPRATVLTPQWYCMEMVTFRNATVGFIALIVNCDIRIWQTGIDTGDNDLTQVNFGSAVSANQTAQRNAFVDCAFVATDRIGCEKGLMPETRLQNIPYQTARIFQYKSH